MASYFCGPCATGGVSDPSPARLRRATWVSLCGVLASCWGRRVRALLGGFRAPSNSAVPFQTGLLKAGHPLFLKPRSSVYAVVLSLCLLSRGRLYSRCAVLSSSPPALLPPAPAAPSSSVHARSSARRCCRRTCAPARSSPHTLLHATPRNHHQFTDVPDCRGAWRCAASRPATRAHTAPPRLPQHTLAHGMPPHRRLVGREEEL